MSPGLLLPSRLTAMAPTKWRRHRNPSVAVIRWRSPVAKRPRVNERTWLSLRWQLYRPYSLWRTSLQASEFIRHLNLIRTSLFT